MVSHVFSKNYKLRKKEEEEKKYFRTNLLLSLALHIVSCMHQSQIDMLGSSLLNISLLVHHTQSHCQDQEEQRLSYVVVRIVVRIVERK